MEIILNKKDKVTATLQIKLNEADYQNKVDNKLREYAKKASIKGFRPGKVPVGMVKKMYGVNVLVDEINNILVESIKNYIKDNDVKIVGEPLPRREEANKIDWNTQKSFEFTYDVGLVPDFDIDPKKIKVEKNAIKIDKKNVDETIESLRNQFGKTDKAEESKIGDFISGKLKQTDGDFENTVMIPTKKLKKETKSFEGVKAGSLITFDLQKAFDGDENAISYTVGIDKDKAKSLKGKFTLEVTDITRVTPAELNQELFDKVFGPGAVSNEQEFNDKILETISNNYDRESELLLGRAIIDEVISSSKLEVSADFVKKWLMATNDKLSTEDIEKGLEFYIKDLKWKLIRNKFVEKYTIKVENYEVVEASKARLLSQLNMPNISPELEDSFNSFAENYLKENNGRNYLNEYENILTQKVVEAIRPEVVVKEKSVSVEKFNEIAQKSF